MKSVSEIETVINTDSTIAKINQLKSLLQEAKELAKSLGVPITITAEKKS